MARSDLWHQHPWEGKALSALIGEGRLERWRLAHRLAQRKRYVLLFSHMRSYSTLLAHLLGSHPQIDGYVEQHQGYETFAELAELHLGVWNINDRQLDGEILFDKILHGKYPIADEVLRHHDVMPIYALREPLSSLRSIVAMGRRRRRGASWRRQPETASVHLFNRYRALCTLAESRADAVALFTDSIVTDPDRTLAALSRHLRLRTPIERDYDRQPMTGVGGFGDPVGPIAAGTIVVDRPEHDVEIPPDLAARLAEAYERTAELLRGRCSAVVGEPVQMAAGGGSRPAADAWRSAAATELAADQGNG